MRNPHFARYMLREASAVFLAGYAVMLLAGLLCLAWGPGAYSAWRGLLETPVSIGLHALALLAALYHSLTWFQVMPKTAPDLPIDPQQIVRGGLFVLAVIALFLFHGCHRMLHSLHDLGLETGPRARLGLYGFATASTIVAGGALLWIGL